MDTPADQTGTPEHRNTPPGGGEASDAALQKYLVELQRTNRALRLLSSINQGLMHVTTENELMRQTCEIAVEIGGYRMAWVGFAEHDAARSVRPVCHAGYEQGYLHQMRFSWADDGNCDPTGMAIRTGKPTIQPDLASLSSCAPWREAALARGYRSTISLPLQIDDRVIGALTLHGDAPYAISQEELQLLTELAGDLSYGISALRIRERQRTAEEALRASEEKFSKAFYTSPDAININRLSDGVYLDINKGFTDLIGFTREEVIGQSSLAGGIDIWVHPEDRQRLVAALREHGEMLGLEAEFRRKNGTTGTGLMSAKLIELNGEPCILSTTRDITERKLAARKLQESEEKYRFLFDTMAQGVVFQDAETRIIETNRAASVLLGVSMEQLLGKTSFDPKWRLVHEDHSPFGPEDMPSNIALRTGKPVTGVVCGVYFPESDDYHWIIISSIPRYQAGATTPYVTMTTFTDITERKRAAEALENSEQKFRSLFETMIEGVALHEVIRNADGTPVNYRVTAVNPAFTQQTGIALTQPGGTLATELYGTDTPPYFDIYVRVVETGEPFSFETFFPPLQKYFMISAFSPGPDTFATVFEDVTDRKRIEDALQDSERRYRLIFELNPVPMWVYDLDTLAFLAVNDAAVIHYGYSREEFLNRTIADIRPPEDVSRLREHIAHTPADTLYSSGIWHHMKRDGSIIDVEITAHNLEFSGHRAKLVLATDVTERLRAEQELRASEERFRVLVEQAPEAITVLDVDLNRFVGANANAERLFGCSREALLSHGPEQFYLPQQPDALPIAESMRKYTAAALAGEEVVFERAIRNAKGRELICEVRLVQLPSVDRTLIRASYIDITERKRTEEALRLTQFSVDRAGDMIFWLDFAGRLLYVNEAGCRRLGYTCEELSHMTVFDIDPIFPREAWAQHSERLRQQRSFIIETQHQTKTGERFPVEISINYMEYNGKEYNFAFVRDITERKRAEEAIKRESTFLASAIELLPFPIFFLTPSFEVIRQNRAGFALQHAPDTLPLGGVEFLDPQTYAPYAVQDWPISHALHGEAMPTQEFILRQRDGREISILLQTAPIFIDDELVAAVVAIQDITSLKEADRAKNQFLMVLSHEVKTPLTSIIGWAQFAQSAPDIVPEALTTILRNAHEQKQLLERLLILSRILTGKLILTCQPTDLWQLALQAEERSRHAAEERHLTFLLEPPDAELRIDADGKLLEQAICEVIDNAVHFTPAGGKVTLQGRQENGVAVLVVHDTGPGIAPEQLSTLLTPFTQLQRKEEIGGLGIGLALARGIIEAHGGRMTITSAGPDQGTTVMFRLPRSGDKKTTHERGGGDAC